LIEIWDMEPCVTHLSGAPLQKVSKFIAATRIAKPDSAVVSSPSDKGRPIFLW